MELEDLAFKLAETVSLPVMLMLDGFYLSHTAEPVDIPDQEMVDRFLPKRASRRHGNDLLSATFLSLGLRFRQDMPNRDDLRCSQALLHLERAVAGARADP